MKGVILRIVVYGGIIAFLAAYPVPGFLDAQARAKVSRAYSDFRIIESALRQYHADQGALPPPSALGNGWTYLPPTLTTPNAYFDILPRDPFSKEGNTFGYARFADEKDAWEPLLESAADMPSFVLISTGPAGNIGPFKLNWNMVYDATNGTFSEGYLYMFGGKAELPPPPPVVFTYDPTNGTSSGGGVRRVRQ